MVYLSNNSSSFVIIKKNSGPRQTCAWSCGNHFLEYFSKNSPASEISTKNKVQYKHVHGSAETNFLCIKKKNQRH